MMRISRSMCATSAAAAASHGQLQNPIPKGGRDEETLHALRHVHARPFARPPVAGPDSAPLKTPADFAFRIKYGVRAKNILGTFKGTFKGTFTKDMVVDPSITIPLPLTREDRLRIYRKMVAIHFFSYPKVFSVSSNGGATFPHPTFSFEVRSNHGTKTVYWDELGQTQNAASRRLMELIELVQWIVQAKPAYKKLPQPRGAYL